MNASVKSLFFLGFLFLLASCGQAPEGEKAETGEAVATATASGEGSTYAIDPAASMIYWEGAKLMGSNHQGTIKLQGGTFTVSNNEVTGGEFVIDMNSLEDTDLKPEDGKAKLEGHLKSGDFFEVETYPTATFTIADIQPATGNPDATHTVKGNLTMKNITKSVTIPVKVQWNENAIMATTPPFTIDRTEWDVMYNATALGTAQDNIINDEVGLRIELKAVPQDMEN
jgi:polyisoprenoid-binding protein YceI